MDHKADTFMKYDPEKYRPAEKPCKRGHKGLRYRSCGACVECTKIYNKDAYSKNREYRRQLARQWREENPERQRETAKRYRRENRELVKERSKIYRERSREKKRAYEREYRQIKADELRQKKHEYGKRNAEYLRAKARAYKAANRERYTENERLRQTRRKEARPAWVDGAEIRAIYATARRLTAETGMPYHVDHIIPLRHPLVCGLHVPWNLQVIPSGENIAKRNHVDFPVLEMEVACREAGYITIRVGEILDDDLREALTHEMERRYGKRVNHAGNRG